MRRLSIALSLGSLAAFVSMLNAMRPKGRDLTFVWEAVQALVHGQDVYTTVPTLFYPLPGIVAAVPLALLPAGPVSSGVFMFIGATAFAWALLAYPGSVIGFFSGGMYFAAEVVQWSPLHAGAFAVPLLGLFLVVKPHVGLVPLFLARPSWWAVGGVVVCSAVAFVIDPQWIQHWRASLAAAGASVGTSGAYPYSAPVLLPGGVLVLLALLRWRRPEARLLVALACVPQSLLLYETVPLALIPRGRKEATTFTALSWVVLAFMVHGKPWPSLQEKALAGGELSTLLLYLPCVVMVLRRPNEGTVPAWLVKRASLSRRLVKNRAES